MFSTQQKALFLLFYILLMLAVPHAGFKGDVDCWARWSDNILKEGLPNLYQYPDVNYNPLYPYVLWAYSKLMGTHEKIMHYPNALKYFTLLFDFAGAFAAVSLVKGQERRFMLALLLLFNAGYMYNTLVWEQIDAIYTFFGFVAVLLALRGNTIFSVVCFLLALNTKAQAIIFLPPLLLLWLPQWLRAARRQVVPALGIAVALQVLILTPFIWFGSINYGPRIAYINLHAADMYPHLYMGACNLWTIIAPDSPLKVVENWTDLAVAHGLTYRQWGMLMFMGASAVALLPLLVLAWRSWRANRRPERAELALVLLSFGIIPLLATYFNTQMHERYWHPAVLFLAAYGFLTRRYWLYVLLSAAYFLQLETIMQYLKLKKYTVLLFDKYFIAGLFTLLVLGAMVELYWQALRTLRAAAPPAATDATTPGAPVLATPSFT
ncbi:hypothetical protein D3Y59_17155 [Hymenobacter oligotrophus]|uniref:DUF2029 domain-containing protein n=1 Tax=Hymenobacter oligotrophus TaxID=2319843 RepID=A0A3B7R3P7_9BACT|nr:hypothetical protein [Hymenobacter oligotrophus]AYA38625.1 hypothetical protein D3Y59_17155 [Hymenobacter oligotrophus]